MFFYCYIQEVFYLEIVVVGYLVFLFFHICELSFFGIDVFLNWTILLVVPKIKKRMTTFRASLAPVTVTRFSGHI